MIDEKIIIQGLINGVKNGDIKLEDVPNKYIEEVREKSK